MADVLAWLHSPQGLIATLLILVRSLPAVLRSVRDALRMVPEVREAWADLRRPRTRTRGRKKGRGDARDRSKGGCDS